MIVPVFSVPVAVYATIPAASPVYQFGTVSLLDMPYADHDFTFANTGTSPVVIDRLQGSCHCTTALIASRDDPDGEPLPYTVPAGASVTIHASINLGMVPAGPVSRTVSLYLQGQDKPAEVYTISGSVEPDVEFTPDELNFGVVHSGQTESMSVLVSIDNRLIHKDFPTLTCDNPAIAIEEVPNPYHGPLRFQAVRPGGETDVRYELIVPKKMPIGKIDAILALVGGKDTIPTAAAQFESDTGAVFGEVLGEMAAKPDAVSFGTIFSGQKAEFDVTLTGNKPADLKGLIVASDCPFIGAALVNGNAVGTSRKLALTIKKTAPTGLFTCKVTVVLANGERLLIPVSGYITIPAQ